MTTGARLNRKLLAGGLVLLGLILGTSLLTAPAKTSGATGPLLSGAQVPADVLATFQRSCQDCHSERTQYPWYSYVAPVSYLIRSDVSRGRNRLNLSRWAEYTLARKMRFLSEIANQVEDRDMPLPQYTLIHRGARLTDAEIQAMFQWTQAERLRLIRQSVEGAR